MRRGGLSLQSEIDTARQLVLMSLTLNELDRFPATF